MGLYSISCSNTGLFYLGLIQIIYNMQKRHDILEYVFADVYTDPYTKEGWEKINATISPYGSTKLIPTGSTPSKHPRQGDGQFTPFALDKSASSCTGMYNKGLEENLFITPNNMKVELTGDWNQIEQGNHMMRWNSICEGYETIKELTNGTQLLWEAINPLYQQNGSTSKSPAQLNFFGGSSCLGKYFGNDSLGGPTWASYNAFTDPSYDLLGTLFNNLSEIWYMPVPTLEEVEVLSSLHTVEYKSTFLEIDDTGILYPPTIEDLTGPATTTVVADTETYSIINVTPQDYPIDTGSVSFRVRYTKMVLS